MKKRYEAPGMILVTLQARHLVAASTTDQDVYTDDPQDVSNALIKENHSIWDDVW